MGEHRGPAINIEVLIVMIPFSRKSAIMQPRLGKILKAYVDESAAVLRSKSFVRIDSRVRLTLPRPDVHLPGGKCL